MEQQTYFSSVSLFPIIATDKNNKGAAFTVVSKATNKDYTLKIARSEWNGRFYTHVRVEKEYQNYIYLGAYRDGNIWRKGQKIETPAAVAINWVLRKIEAKQFDSLDQHVKFAHLGKCIRCGKTLTDHQSIKLGLGPICKDSVKEENIIDIFKKLNLAAA